MIPLLLATMCRVGEAKTPGPSEHQSWSIAVCNPSGVLGKTALVASLDADLIAMSETHLTKTSRNMFRSSLMANSSYRFLVTGQPLNARYVDSLAGQWSGVATTAKHPSRALCAAWPTDMYESGRVQLTGTYLGTTWVTGGLIYGYPLSKYHKQPLQRTNALLRHVAEHLLLVATGPRYMCGDWNHDIHDLEVTEMLTKCGWQEVQSLELQARGTAIQPTCKQKTRRDFLWLSPELCSSFRSVRVQHDVFTDHSVLFATFDLTAADVTRFVWPCPKPIQWSLVQAQPAEVSFDAHLNPSDQYQQVWAQQEDCAQQELQTNWQPSMAGRAQQRAPRQVQGWQPPPKKARSSDPQPQFFGYNIQHSRWLRQLRRLDNYARWATHHWTSDALATLEHGMQLWSSVLRAPGFRPQFATWWTGRHYHGLGDVTHIPLGMPPPAVAVQIVEMFTSEVRWLERLLSSNKRTLQVHKHTVNRNLIFRDVKRPTPEPVTSLLHRATTTVVAIDTDDNAVIVDPPQEFAADAPILVGGIPTEIIHATSDKLFVADLAGINLSDKVVQTKPLGKLQDIFDAFHVQWKQRWCKHDAWPSSHWQEIVDFGLATLQRHPCPLLSITPELLRAEAAHKKPTSATGLDGVSRHDLLGVADSTLRSIVNMFDNAQATGRWPTQVVAGKVASLAKHVDAEGCNDFRPITVFSLCYRCWSSLHSRALLQWASSWCDSDVFGNRQGHQTADLWSAITAEIQVAHDQSLALTGLTADIVKAYNCLPRWPILSSALAAGSPFQVIHAWAGALSQMVRHFKVRDSYSSGFASSTGLAEGCGLSCFGMLVLDHLCHRWFAA